MKTLLQLNAEAVSFRQKVGYGNREPIDIESIALNMSHYTIIKLGLSNKISGMCIADNESKLIAINSSMSLGRQRFTIAHELYHLEIEQLIEGKICPTGIYDNRCDNEKEADMFASFVLMPYDGLMWYIENYNISEWNMRNIIGLSQFYKMSYMAVLFRLYFEERITKEQYEKYQRVNIRREALKYGYDVALYEASSQEDAWTTLGEYPRVLEEKRSLIPESLFYQFCEEGFRDDIKTTNVREDVAFND